MRDKRLYFGLLALLLLVLLNLPMRGTRRVRGVIRDVLYPFENTLVTGMRRVASVLGSTGQRASLLAENERLALALAEREFRIQELEEVRKENEELRQQLGFAILSPRTLLLAEVTARGELGGWWQTVRINKGHRDGVLPDMAVMTAEGLIGRTMDVASRSSEVLLITDPNSKLSAKVERNRALGVMQGSGIRAVGKDGIELFASALPAQMQYLPATYDLVVGDRVVTSGLGHVFPDGLPVGNIVSVQMHASGLYQQAKVQPFADLRSLRYVFVVMD